jgi:hypothetical protein
MKPPVYDAGVLIAAERNHRRLWLSHRVRLEAGLVPCVPSTVVAQVSRSPNQVQLRRFLRGCEVVALREEDAHAVGALLGKSRTSDVVDASVVVLASQRHGDIHTADGKDMERLVSAAGSSVGVAALDLEL